MSSLAPKLSRPVDQHSIEIDQGHHAPTQDSAQRGASRAFHAMPTTAKVLVNTYSGTNGALAAAVKAGSGASGREDNRRSGANAFVADKTEQHSLFAGRDPMARKRPDTALPLASSKAPGSERRQSQSYIAATRAAARATPGLLGDDNGGTTPIFRTRNVIPRGITDDDQSSIPPTTKLVELFEAKQDSNLRDSGTTSASSSRPSQAIVSPLRIRLPTPSTSPELSQNMKSHEGANRVSPSTAMVERNNADSEAREWNAAGSSISMLNSRPGRLSQARARPEPPPPRGRTQSRSNTADLLFPSHPSHPDHSFRSHSTSESSHASARNTLSGSSSVPKDTSNRLKPQQTAEFPVPRIIKLQPDRPSSSPSPSPLGSRKPSLAKPAVRNTIAQLTPQLTADSLANAIVASSLASSRASSPAKTGPALPQPRRQGKTQVFSLLLPSPPAITRTPSPMKSMRHTMRPSRSSSDEESKGIDRVHGKPHNSRHSQQHRGLLIRKHPNKHAEGARRRWRDSITELERKRYEGLWAANRGILIPIDEVAPEEVHSYVCRDLWKRSGLGQGVLEQIWDLVSRPGSGTKGRASLRRDEFVVGLWLVDQCLKGRRLPSEVGESVWASVRRLPMGIRTR